MLTREFLEHARRVVLRAMAERSGLSAQVWSRAYADTFGDFTTAVVPGGHTASGPARGNGAAGPVPARRKWWEEVRR